MVTMVYSGEEQFDLVADDDARLLVGVDNKLLLQNLVDVFQQPQVLYEDNNKSVVVTGIRYLSP